MVPEALQDRSGSGMDGIQAIGAVILQLRGWAAEGPPRNMRATFAHLAGKLEDAMRNLRQQVAMAEVAEQARESVELAREQKALMLEESYTVASKVADLKRRLQAVLAELDSSRAEKEALANNLNGVREREVALASHVASCLAPVTSMCRVRPADSYQEEHSVLLVDGSEIALDVKDATSSGRQRKFRVDRVLDDSAAQEDVFAATAPWVEHAINGGASCILAYGATGAGKTYTMSGEGATEGVCHRALQRLLSGTHARSARVSVVEVYCDQIRDLLSSPSDAAVRAGTSTPLRRDGQGRAQLECTAVPVSSTAAAEQVLARGFANRTAEATLCNDRSSRSHVVMTVQLVSAIDNAAGGRLVLVDLAGSENVQRSGADEGGKLLTEAKAINKSLSALADVVEATAKRQSFIPYRNSRLTMLLEDTLSAAKVLLIAHVSPLARDATDTGHSLQFAGRIRAVDFGAQQLRRDAEERLKSAHQRDQQEIQRLQNKVDSFLKEKDVSQQQEKDLKQQVAQLSEQLREKSRELVREQERITKLEGSVREQRYAHTSVTTSPTSSTSSQASRLSQQPTQTLRSSGGSAPDLHQVLARQAKAPLPAPRRHRENAVSDMELEKQQHEAPRCRAPLGDLTNSEPVGKRIEAKPKLVSSQDDSALTKRSVGASTLENEPRSSSQGKSFSPHLVAERQEARTVASVRPATPMRPSLRKLRPDAAGGHETDAPRVLADPRAKERSTGERSRSPVPRLSLPLRSQPARRQVRFDEEVQQCSPPRWYMDHLEATQEMENAVIWKPLFRAATTSQSSPSPPPRQRLIADALAAPPPVVQSPVLSAPIRKKEVRIPLVAWAGRDQAEAANLPRWR